MKLVYNIYKSYTHTHIIYCTIFSFLAYCVGPNTSWRNGRATSPFFFWISTMFWIWWLCFWKIMYQFWQMWILPISKDQLDKKKKKIFSIRCWKGRNQIFWFLSKKKPRKVDFSLIVSLMIKDLQSTSCIKISVYQINIFFQYKKRAEYALNKVTQPPFSLTYKYVFFEKKTEGESLTGISGGTKQPRKHSSEIRGLRST